MAETPGVRGFDTGAIRTRDDNKPDYEGFLSPLSIERYGQFMHKHRFLPDGARRASDNWQKGIPLDAYAKSLIRHTMQFHKLHRGYPAIDWDTHEPVDQEEMLCAIVFNAMGYLHEVLKAAPPRGTAPPVDLQEQTLTETINESMTHIAAKDLK